MLQFFDYSTYSELSYENDSNYKIAGFLLSSYPSNEFNRDENIPFHEGIAVAMIEKTRTLQSYRAPSEGKIEQ